MDELKELNGLVTAYNQAEGEQSERLRQILGILKRRKGYRRVGFTNRARWTCCQNNQPDTAWLVDSLEARIDYLDAGDG